MPRASAVSAVHNRAEDKPWAHVGEYLNATRIAESATREVDARLERDISTQIGSEGGFAVPAGLLDSFLQEPGQESQITSRTTERTVTQGNEYDGAVIDESDSRADGSRNGGVQLQRVAEGGTYQYSWPKLRQVKMNLLKRGCVVPATNEMVEDSPSYGADIAAIASKEIRFIRDNEIWNGNGVGYSLGVRSAPSLIPVAIEATQTIANTPAFINKNAANMMARAWILDNACWFLQQELLTSILTATVNSNANPLVTPPDEDAPFGRLYTRPLFPLEVAPSVGTVGDFVLADMSDYLTVQKGGIRQAISVHTRFLTDESLFRFTIRINGQPKCSGPITPYAGALTRSPYVALAARA